MIKDGYGFSEVITKVDEHFGGTANLEFVVDTGKMDGMKSVAILKAMEQFSDDVLKEQSYYVNRSFSLVNLTKESYQRLTDNQLSNHRIPDTGDEVAQTLSMFEAADSSNRALVVGDNWQLGRMTFSGFSRGSYEYRELMDYIELASERAFGPLRKDFPAMTWHATGNLPLTMHLVELITISQLQSFAIAVVVICLLLLLVYGSLKFGLLAMVPNLFPLLMLAGAAGWLGIPFDSDTLLVVPIAIGIAVDDTIHFLTHYRSELLRGMGQELAIDRTLSEVGQAMTFTTVILATSFMCYVFMIYKPLGNFGVLSAISIGSALIADLFLVPVLLRKFKPFEDQEVGVCVSEASV
jgi:predicted RND superfamily exporter protein